MHAAAMFISLPGGLEAGVSVPSAANLSDVMFITEAEKMKTAIIHAQCKHHESIKQLNKRFHLYCMRTEIISLNIRINKTSKFYL